MTQVNSQFDFKSETAKQEELQKKSTIFSAPPVKIDEKGTPVAIDPSLDYIHRLLAAMVSKKGSDMFITAGFPPAMKLNGSIEPLTNDILSPEHTQAFVRAVMNDKQWKEFTENKRGKTQPSGRI